MTNKRDNIINRWAWLCYDHFILEMKDRWDSKDRNYDFELRRKMWQVRKEAKDMGVDFGELDSRDIDPVLQYCHDHKREE